MQTIYKYPVEVNNRFALELPRGAEILCVQCQQDLPYLWVRVETTAPVEPRTFVTRGTGHPLDGSEGRYLGTVQMNEGAFVLHVFEAD